MQRVNPEGLYATIQAVLPVMKKNHSKNGKGKGRIVVVSPPIYSRFFRGKTAYAMGKVGMSVLTKGLAMDFDREGREEMSVTSIWPAVVCSFLLLSSYDTNAAFLNTNLFIPPSINTYTALTPSTVHRIRRNRTVPLFRPRNRARPPPSHNLLRQHPSNAFRPSQHHQWSLSSRWGFPKRTLRCHGFW